MSDIKQLQEKLDMIKQRLSEEDFLANRGLSNEVGFHFFCYDPKYEMLVRHYTDMLKADTGAVYNIIEHDLYEIFLDILEEKRVLKSVASLEEKKGKDHLLSQIQKIASPMAFASKLKYEPHNYGDVLVLTGVGKVFPYIRIDQLMDNLQAYFPDMPMVVFYPGEFDGNGIKLFNLLPIRPYYRAFNLL